MTVYSILGYTVATDFPFETPMATSADPPDLSIHMGDPPWAAADSDALAVWHSNALLDSGVPVQSIHRFDARHTLYRFGEVVDFYLEPDRITIVLLDAEYDYIVEIRLLGPVLALMRELEGKPALHGSAVVIDDNAVGFVSRNGGGKTTAAAGFVLRGRPLQTDDVIVVDMDGDSVSCLSGYPQMRMWPEAARRLVGRVDDLALVHPKLGKRRVPIGEDGIGTFHDGPMNLRVLFELNRVPGPEFGVEVARVVGAERVMTLVRHCFLGTPVHGIGLGGDRLVALGAIVDRVPVLRVEHSGSFDDLDRLCDALAEVTPT